MTSETNLSRKHLEELLSFVEAKSPDTLPILALSGAPGTGKSTLAHSLSTLAEEKGHRVATISLDDVYRSKRERLERAKSIHPLAAFRGPPTTHDLPLLERTLDRLASAKHDEETPLPRFDKLEDDRVPPEKWPRLSGRPSLVLLDGWCLGALPVGDAKLVEPMNERERSEDSDGSYRKFVDAALSREYTRLFERVTARFHFETAWENVLGLREEQEAFLARSRGARFLSPEGIVYFLELFERVARGPFETEKLALTATLGRDRRLEAVRWFSGASSH